MGEARAKAAGEIGGPIRCGRKVGVSGEASNGMVIAEAGWGKGTSKGTELLGEGEGDGDDWFAIDSGNCWGAREQGGVEVDPGCPKAAVIFKAGDIGSIAGG